MVFVCPSLLLLEHWTSRGREGRILEKKKKHTLSPDIQWCIYWIYRHFYCLLLGRFMLQWIGWVWHLTSKRGYFKKSKGSSPQTDPQQWKTKHLHDAFKGSPGFPSYVRFYKKESQRFTKYICVRKDLNKNHKPCFSLIYLKSVRDKNLVPNVYEVNNEQTSFIPPIRCIPRTIAASKKLAKASIIGRLEATWLSQQRD